MDFCNFMHGLLKCTLIFGALKAVWIKVWCGLLFLFFFFFFLREEIPVDLLECL